MKIEHIALYVNDLEASRNFFRIFFPLKDSGGRIIPAEWILPISPLSTGSPLSACLTS